MQSLLRTLFTVSLLGLTSQAYAQDAANEAVQEVLQERVPNFQSQQREEDASQPIAAEQTGNSSNNAADTAAATSSVLQQRLPSFQNLERLEQLMREQPNNLDHYFTYARMATTLGEFERAVDAYEQMLEKAPSLDRVRLDMGMVLLQMGDPEGAKAELEHVRERDIPDSVRENIERVLAQIDEQLREHDHSTVVTAGLTFDSNANSAPQNGEILVFDTRIPLGGTQLEQEDWQRFVSLSYNHTYRPRALQGEDWSMRWKNNLNYYDTEQEHVDTLNLSLVGLRTGPEFTSKEWNLRTGLGAGYSHITLDNHAYLRQFAFDAFVEKPLDDQFVLNASVKQEIRDFLNAPSITTYDDRSGTATQGSLGLRYIISGKDFLSVNATVRRERTQRDYYTNDQWGGSLGYTRILPLDMYANARIGFRNSQYDGPDGLISQRTRDDNEYTAGLNIAKRLNETVTLSAGYQYRNVDSNLSNYDYDNHKVTSSVSLRF
ncbi:MAG: hypothetical protein CMM94_03455 [Rickettsiales bacterium]|nr:hypothetical protein [Rickettsiales bacterium]